MIKPKRALWLMNHTTLKNFEVPLIQEMGYEIFIPKSFPYDEGNLSASIDYSYDDKLTIPKHKLKILNEADLYGDFSPEVVDIINEYFEIAFFGFFPSQLKSLVMHFTGQMVFQPFGLSNGLSYTQVIADSIGIWFLKKLESLGNQFVFGEAYENLSEIEYPYFQKQAVYLPVGLKNAEVNDRWTGEKNKILFVCPRINTSDYYHQVYDNFKTNFGDFDHSIGGAQPIPVTDDHILGFLSREEYDLLYPSHKLMFYHSQEQNHIHYHPLEAVVCGLPLLFMAGGMLDKLGGKNLPGRCKSIDDARNKIQKIFEGDLSLISEIRNSQSILLEKFTHRYCQEKWTAAFANISSTDNKNKLKAPKRIAVIMPAEYTGGVLDFSIRFIKALKKSIDNSSANIELVFAHLDHPNFDDRDYFQPISEVNVPIRKFKWDNLSSEKINQINQLLELPLRPASGEFCTINDGIGNFNDCDAFIFTSDRAPSNIYLLKPYGVCVHDFIQRHLVSFFGNFYESNIMALQRHAQAVFAYSKPTISDCTQYAGVPQKRIHLIPMLFESSAIDTEILNHTKPDNDKKYIVWATNISSHKNHKPALQALSHYYARGGTLDCYITGADTLCFDPNKKVFQPNEYSSDVVSNYIAEIHNLIKHDAGLLKHLHIVGNLPKEKYLYLLKHAHSLFHPGMYDAGNMASFDAALLGVPTISADYPAMRYYEERMSLGITFFDLKNSESLISLLLENQNSNSSLQKRVPSVDKLSQFVINNTHEQLFDTVTFNLGLA